MDSPQFDRSAWTIPPEVTYLNHGSFGPSPRVVQEVRQQWSARLESQPMNFFLRDMEPALDRAAQRLGAFIQAEPRDLLFVDNATAAMNIVASTVTLQADDEVLLNDHEYGAVRRIWQRACDAVGAKLVTAAIPTPIASRDDVVAAIDRAITPRTRLIVVSHITSPTAIIFPVAEICRRAREARIPVCIDGPHAIAMIPLQLRELRPAFYCASLHKWLSAPFGSGFLYVDRSWQSKLSFPMTSWGRSLCGRSARWQDEWNWQGTRDPAPFLSVAAAIDFLDNIGWEQFRQRCHALAAEGRRRLEALFDTESLIPDDPSWYGTMITVPLPVGPSLRTVPNAPDPWQQALWHDFGIEIPIVDWHGRRHIRVSCHLYNDEQDLDRLCEALKRVRASR